MPTEIRELSKSMINKIAAGEVIERPANVVKELAENSLDAGARRVVVEVEQSGVEMIRVIDDGRGIPADQLVAALSPHSTSKISEPDDLFHIATLGFRGEALASIAEVSHLTLSSRAQGASEGAQISCQGGEKGEIVPVGRDVGTTIEARNLFFNVPVRRKFLKSAQTEFSHIQEAVSRLAIPRFDVAFTLTRNGRTVLDLPVSDSMLDRIRRVYGDAIASRLVPIEWEGGRKDRDGNFSTIRISGFVGIPDLVRPSASMQYLFVNGRYFRDKALQHALTEAYRNLVNVGKYPVVFLNLITSPDFVDVNVHPTKQEVRFLDGQAMYANLLAGLRERFQKEDLKSRPTDEELAEAAGLPPSDQFARETPTPAQIAPPPIPAADDEPRELTFVPDPDPNEEADPRAALDESVVGQARAGVTKWLDQVKEDSEKRREQEEEPDDVADAANAALEEAAALDAENAERRRSQAERDRDAFLNYGKTPEFQRYPELPIDPRSTFDRDPDEFRSRPAPIVERRIARDSQGRPVVQMRDRYLVMETDDGIAIVDQHALHERVLFEKLKASLLEGAVVSQRLLSPEVVDLPAAEATFAVENPDLFAKVGLDVAHFGGTSVIINAYPALLRALPPSEIFQIALDAFLSNRSSDISTLVDAALKQASCKAAIKAGDALRDDEIAELIRLAEEEINSHHCPHGRPSTLVFTCAELDKLFKRT